MGLTNLDALSLSGVPIFGSLGLLAMSGGKVYFVDPTSTIGNDGNDGSADFPLQTLAAAHTLAVDGRGDIIVLKGGPASGGGTGMTARQSATLTWSKNNTHLLGIGARTMVGQRSRISTVSGGTFAPLMDVTGSGCEFHNFSMFDDTTVNPICMRVTGARNHFSNVNIGGMGAANGAADTAGRSLSIEGGSENTFDGCRIGLDTVSRTAANAEIGFTSQAARNTFRNCHIVSYVAAVGGSASHLFVDASAASSLDRDTVFDECIFVNYPTGLLSALTLTNAMNIGSASGGIVLLKKPMFIGATNICAADNGNVFIDYTYDGTQGTKAGAKGVALLR